MPIRLTVPYKVGRARWQAQRAPSASLRANVGCLDAAFQTTWVSRVDGTGHSKTGDTTKQNLRISRRLDVIGRSRQQVRQVEIGEHGVVVLLNKQRHVRLNRCAVYIERALTPPPTLPQQTNNRAEQQQHLDFARPSCQAHMAACKPSALAVALERTLNRLYYGILCVLLV